MDIIDIEDKPVEYEYQLSRWAKEKEQLSHIVKTLDNHDGDYVVAKSDKGYAVFTQGKLLISENFDKRKRRRMRMENALANRKERK